MIAKEVTVPVHVNEWNIDEMKQYIENGPNVHPGANYVIRKDGRKIRVLEETKEMILEQLECGFVIERHLKDGDMVLFNRQPSLHRMSMMAHEVRVLPYKTFRLNLCVCPPYNADFDGDEMNMHVFQTDESRAEAKYLMRVQEHILSPRFGEPRSERIGLRLYAIAEEPIWFFSNGSSTSLACCRSLISLLNLCAD